MNKRKPLQESDMIQVMAFLNLTLTFKNKLVRILVKVRKK